MSVLRYSDVFVPGGFPKHTYNPRATQRLENRLSQVLENLCKLVTVTGHTKSGKTVLVRKIIPREESIWVDGGAIGEEDDFWNTVLDQLGEVFQSREESKSVGTSAAISGGGKAEANFIIAKGEATAGGTIGATRTDTSASSRTVSTKVSALRGLRSSKVPLVIDDFHYLPRNLQGSLVRALKPLIFDGQAVVLIAIPHRRYDALKVEKEMTGRIWSVEVPIWNNMELEFIPTTGFSKLNRNSSEALVDALCEESIGSPHLIQEFCRSLCHKLEIVDDTLSQQLIEVEDEKLKSVFSETAETIGRPIFEKLARGPRQRSDRIPRQLKSGKTVDIYGLVLHGLAHIKPDLITLEYEDLRSAIREVLADESQSPRLHEIARVLKHMSDIAATDQSSTPVIDFDEEDKRLHVTDPFFAFYLRWGSLESQ